MRGIRPHPGARCAVRSVECASVSACNRIAYRARKCVTRFVQEGNENTREIRRSPPVAIIRPSRGPSGPPPATGQATGEEAAAEGQAVSSPPRLGVETCPRRPPGKPQGRRRRPKAKRFPPLPRLGVETCPRRPPGKPQGRRRRPKAKRFPPLPRLGVDTYPRLGEGSRQEGDGYRGPGVPSAPPFLVLGQPRRPPGTTRPPFSSTSVSLR